MSLILQAVFAIILVLITANLTFEACSPPDCNGNGLCDNKTKTCKCDLPFTAEGCTRDPCKVVDKEGEWIDKDCNKGVCIPNPDDKLLPFCNCFLGYFGLACDSRNACFVDINGQPHNPPICVGGMCEQSHPYYIGNDTHVTKFDTFECNCPEGKVGDYCDDNPCKVPNASEIHCNGNGRCDHAINRTNGRPYPSCTCKRAYSGPKCEIANPCLFTSNKDYCQGYSADYKGACVRVSNTEMNCTCKHPFIKGVRCEIVDLCKLEDDKLCNRRNRHHVRSLCMPCANKGVCKRLSQESGKGKYSCNCSNTDYLGERCEIRKGRIKIIPKDATPLTDNASNIVAYQVKAGKEHVYYIVTNTSDENVEFNIDTGDGLSFTSSFSLFKNADLDYDMFSNISDFDVPFKYYAFSHVYLAGNYNFAASLEIADFQIAKKMESIVAVLPPEANCTPSTKLRNVAHDPGNVIDYKRTDRFVVEAILQFNCYENEFLTGKLNAMTDQFRYEWIMFRASNSFPSPTAENKWYLEQLTNATEKYVVFEPRVLVHGFYLIECRAFVKLEGNEYGHSEIGYFRITLNPPRIVLKGSSENTEVAHIVVDKDTEIMLDASESVDESFPEDPGLFYFWKCDLPCEEGPWEGPVLTIPPGTFEPGSKVKIFLRVISLHSVSAAIKWIEINIMNNVSVTVECTRNCDKFNPGDEVVFHCNYILNGKPGPTSQITWDWNPKDEVIPERKLSLNSTASVVLPKVSDVAPRSIFCNVTPPGLKPLWANFELSINVPPMDGRCLVKPSTGKYLITEFNISCSNFVDSNLPLQYSFYAEVHSDGILLTQLGDRILLGYEKNPKLDFVYLPLGNASQGSIVNVTVKIMDDHGLSTTVVINVTVLPPPSTQYPKLFHDLIYGNESLMRKRIVSGDTQGALQLQMVAAYGLYHQEIASALSPEEHDILLTVIETNLLTTPIPSFKAVEQVIDTLHILDHIESRNDSETFTNVSRALFQTASVLGDFARLKEEVTAKREVDILARAEVDSSSRILKACHTFGTAAQELQPEFLYHVNHRDMSYFDPDDDNERTYFFEVHDDNDDFLSEGFDEVSDSADVNVKKYAKVCHHTMLAFEHIMNAAVGHLGYVTDFDMHTDVASVHAEILPDDQTDPNLTWQLRNIKISIPNETLVAVHDKLDENHADIEFQVIATDINPFYDDTSADPQTPILSLVLKDSENHVPILIDKLPHPIQLTFPFTKSITEAEIGAGTSRTVEVKVSPAEEIDDFTEFAVFKLNLPYNSIVYFSVQDRSSGTLYFKFAAVKDRRPQLNDFCNSSVNANGDGLSGQFMTESLNSNESSPEPFLEYHVGFLPVDPTNPDSVQSFSAVFSRPSCLFRDEDRKYWSEQVCIVQPDSISYHGGTFNSSVPKPSRLTCLCNHISIFSAVQFIVPHTIENLTLVYDVSVKEIRSNPVVLITVCIILLLYFIGLVLCRLYDSRDESRDVGLTIMADLRYSRKIRFYMITVQTGCNFYAGTTSSIGIAIYGSLGRSKLFILKDRNNSVFLRGGIDTFLISDKDLGDLEKIRIWSDYSGHDPDWYCRKVVIRCLSTKQLWYFYINQWFSVTAEASTVILEIPATTEEEQTKFFVRFRENIMEHFNNVNLWLSLFRYSPVNTFTRCQRFSCAIGILTGYLFVDILFHGTPTEDEDGLFEFGEYTIDVYALVKAIQVIVLSVPIGVILIGLFRYIVPKQSPTLILWSGVVPALAQENIQGRNFFIPKIINEAEVKTHRLPNQQRRVKLASQGQVHSIFTFKKGLPDEEASENEMRQPVPFDRISKASSGADSNFSIPSTDIPALEKRIADSSGTQAADKTDDSSIDSLEDDDELDQYSQDKYTYSLESQQGLQNDSREANNIFRLGRRAIIEKFRDVDPNLFIFQGPNEIATVEDLIDKQLLEGQRKNKPKKKKIKRKKKDVKPEDEGKVKMKEAPWQKAVTEEYLKDIDKKLEDELASKRFMQSNWKPHMALEMCMLPRVARSRFKLPWWFNVIAWFFCLATIGLMSVLTVTYGIHYGYLRSRKWLDTYVDSFLMSLFVIQPISGCLTTLIMTTLGQNTKIEERVQVMERNNEDKEFLNERQPFKYHIFDPTRKDGPPRGSEIFRLSVEAKRKYDLRTRLIRLVLYLVIIVPLIAVSYSGHNSHNYAITNNLRNMFHLNNLGEGKTQFKNEEMVHKYLMDVVVTNLHPTTYYNGQNITRNLALISDQQTILVGVARLRQQRVKPEKCPDDKLDALLNPASRKRCTKSHSFKTSTQDRSRYNPQWNPADGEKTFSSITNDGWEFHDEHSTKPLSRSLRGHQGNYDGGGYILELGTTKRESESVLKYIKRTRWMDHRTRAIFIEFTLLNPNINKFVDVVLLIEQAPTWTFNLISWITPMELIPIEDLHRSDEVTWISVSIATIILVLLLLMFVFIHDLCYIPLERLVSRTAFWLDLTIIIMIFTSLCISFVRFVFAKEFGDLIDSQKTNDYLSIQKAAHWNDIQRIMFSLSQALVFIKIWKLLMFTDQRFLTFALTLKLTSKYIFAFILILTVFLCAFAMSGNFIFGNDLWEFSSWSESMVSLVDQVLGVTFASELSHSNRVLGPVYTSIFGLIIIFMGINFVIALLDLGVHEAKEVVHQRRVWLTYSQYISNIFRSVFPQVASKHSKIKEMLVRNRATLRPERLHGMELETAAYLRNFLKRSKAFKMKEMAEHCNKILAGTGYRMVGRKQKFKQKDVEKQQHIEQLRGITAVYLRDKLGIDMTPEEFKEYADFNRKIVRLRVKKLEMKAVELCERMDEFLRNNNYVYDSE